MLLEVSHLRKRFGRREALLDVSFHVNEAEILGLIGPNGAGKSTLFECLAGVLPCDSGAVMKNGKPVDNSQRRDLLFYTPDNITPWPHESVGWALEFCIGFLGGQSTLHSEIIAQLDLGDLLSQRLGALSKGQRKRVLLAIGLLTAQPVLLIDEPFEGLDLRQAREVAKVLRIHVARGRTLFLSIHQINEAAKLCQRFVLLNNGRVKGEGSEQELSTLAKSLNPAQPFTDLEEVFLALT